jgi:integral membrane protein (TIGR01906 family)
VGAVAAIDFEKAFEVFHKLFFPGKENWLFDPRVDEIINVMPFEFFRNCAILILSSVVIISVTFIIMGIKAKKNEKSKDRKVI